MKEFRADTGGRYTYNEDLLNLQDLALAFNEIFANCDNFIVSGCTVDGTTIDAGYVYINRKLRYFSGASNITQWPQYIYETNYSENTSYANGGQKIARTIYGCQISNQQPSAPDDITGELPGILPITSTGGKTLKDAFFGKYALLTNPTTAQTIDKALNISDNLNVSGIITANNGLKMSSGHSTTKIYYSDNTFIVECRAGGNGYQFQVVEGGGFQFYVNGTLCFTIDGANGIVCNVPISGSKATFGGLALTENKLYQNSVAGDATLYINTLSKDGQIENYRNTVIGNGKGRSLLTVNGALNTIFANSPIYVDSNSEVGLVLKASMLKTSAEMQNYILWQDNSNVTTAKIGFTSADDNIFKIHNNIASIDIISADYVNIGPAIKENGTLLSEKYVLKRDYDASMNNKTNIGDVYSKTEANNTFAAKSQGFSQFIGYNTAEALRNQIGAVGQQELARRALLSNCLSDMAINEAAKAQIRENIGACAAGDYQPVLKDSGWKYLSGTKALYIRQIGNIISIQGKIVTVHDGNAFTIPNTIDCPIHGVYITLALENKKSWACEIAPNQRNCVVKYCDGSCGTETYFSLTYMV